MKTQTVKKAMLRKLAPLLKANEIFHVQIQMKSPVLQAAPGGGVWFPTQWVEVDKVMDLLAADWHIVFRESSNGNSTDGRP